MIRLHLKRIIQFLSYIACLILLILPGVSSAILNPPHNATNGINCDSCHFTFSNTPAWWSDSPANIDDVPQNRVCWQAGCHDGTAPYKKTHSSFATESNTYGEWTWQCVACHNPHHQRQVYFNEYPAGLTGIITAVDAGTRTFTLSISLPDRTGDADPIDDYIGWTIVPHIPYKTINYKIASNTATTVTVTGDINTARVFPGTSTFGIIIGRFLKDVIYTPGGPKYVKFYKSEGDNSFSDGNSATGIDGVCEVCHTQTKNASTLAARYRNNAHADSHYEAQDCTNCHTHTEGFKALCNLCHGSPPVDAGTLVFDPAPTGSITAGAHSKHVNGRNIPCNSCHVNNTSAGHNDSAPQVITMGFSLFSGAYIGGSYDGQGTAQYDSSDPVNTSVSNGSSKTCNNIYCHGKLPDGTNWGSGSNTTPAWDGSVNCGDCHGATSASPPPRGSHSVHARQYNNGYNYSCSLCHKDPSVDDVLHVNNKSEIVFSTDPMTSGGSYAGTDTMLDAYGTCTNVYCHSTVQSSPPGSGPTYRTTPTWGVSGSGCDRCHYFSDSTPQLSTGSHTKHFYNMETDQCYACHNWDNSDDPCFSCHNESDFWELRKKHANYVINVEFAPKYGGSYLGSTTPGVGYGDCSNVYCHGNYSGSGMNATPTWGTASTAACGTCHGASNTTPPDSGSHEKHAGDGRTYTTVWQNNREYACTLCHNGIVGGSGPASYTIADTTKHVNKLVDWNFDTSDSRLSIGTPSYNITSGTEAPSDGTARAYGTCSNVYCHSNVQPDGGIGPPDVYTTPANMQWGTVKGCYGCHAGETGTDRSRHSNIHTGSHDKHVAVQTDATNECLICHNWNDPADVGGGCGNCHPAASVNNEKTRHVDGEVTMLFSSSKAGPNADYNGTTQPGDGYSNCSNIACHSDGTYIRTGDTAISNTTPTWGDSIAGCNVCHGNAVYPSPKDGMPNYDNIDIGGPKENSHKEHMIDLNIAGNNIGCEFCHWYTTEDGVNIANAGYHARGRYSIWGATTNRQFLGRDVWIRMYYSPSTISVQPTYGGACREISCHGSIYPNREYMVESYYTYWGHYQQCGDCHMQKAVTSEGGTVGHGDIDNFTIGGGSHATLDGDQWRYSGHGKESGTYDVSGNPAADFTGAANCSTPEPAGCAPCLYCHDENVDHDWDNTSTNPFRLANYNPASNNGNDVCLVCHATGSSGYNGSSGLMPNKNATVKIDKYHYGSDHGASNDGGSLCWDCHDPHGDRTADTDSGGNIYMIHTVLGSDTYGVIMDKDDVNGKPLVSVITNPAVFTADTTGTDYIVANPGPYTGICQVCHTQTNHHRRDGLAPGDWDGVPGASNYLGHNNNTKCTTCHQHSGDTTVDGNAFANP